MPNTLVIVESPAKARTIEKYLGKGYTVESSIGHIRDLPRSAAEIPEKYKNEAWARLGLNVEDGEKWIVNLIRDTRLDAQIDSKEGTVIMNHPPSSVYQQVIERTKGGFFRTQVLNAAVAIR